MRLCGAAAGMIAPEHRPDLLPLVARCLFGKLFQVRMVGAQLRCGVPMFLFYAAWWAGVEGRSSGAAACRHAVLW